MYFSDSYICILLYILPELENDLGEVEMLFINIADFYYQIFVKESSRILFMSTFPSSQVFFLTVLTELYTESWVSKCEPYWNSKNSLFGWNNCLLAKHCLIW